MANFTKILKMSTQIPIEVNTIPELGRLLKQKTLFEHQEIILGKLDELSFIQYIKKNDYSYDRIGFKKWKIIKLQNGNFTGLYIRLTILIITILLLIINGSMLILHSWPMIEKKFLLLPIAASIIAAIIVSLIGYFYKKFRIHFFNLLKLYLE